MSLKTKLFRLVRKGRLERLQNLVNQSFASDGGTSGISTNAATVYLLASVVDSCGRRLLHLACEHGHLRMVRLVLSWSTNFYLIRYSELALASFIHANCIILGLSFK